MSITNDKPHTASRAIPDAGALDDNSQHPPVCIHNVAWGDPDHDCVTADTTHAAMVGELIVNEDTGEVIEWPAHLTTAAAKAEYVASQMAEATRQRSLWDAHNGRMKGVAAGLMREMGLESLRTEHGLIKGVGTETVDLDKLPEVQRQFEIPQVMVNALVLGAASTLSPKRTREVAEEIGFPSEALGRLMRVTSSLRLYPSKKAAPEVRPL